MKSSAFSIFIFCVFCLTVVKTDKMNPGKADWGSFRSILRRGLHFFSDLPGIIQSLLQKSIEAKSYGCQCADYSCGCCAHLEVPRIGLNDTGCVNLTYLPKDYGISFTMTIDKLTIYNETISARSPPPICFGAPILKEYADLCVHFYDLDATTTKLHGCVDLEARMHKIVVGRYKIGCFNIGEYVLGRWSEFHRRLIEKMRADKNGNKVELVSTNSY